MGGSFTILFIPCRCSMEFLKNTPIFSGLQSFLPKKDSSSCVENVRTIKVWTCNPWMVPTNPWCDGHANFQLPSLIPHPSSLGGEQTLWGFPDSSRSSIVQVSSRPTPQRCWCSHVVWARHRSVNQERSGSKYLIMRKTMENGERKKSKGGEYGKRVLSLKKLGEDLSFRFHL